MSSAFETAKAIRDGLDGEVARTGARLELFPKNGPMGLTPDHVKASPEFRAAKAAFDRAFANLRNFNKTYTVQFAGELRAERAARREHQLLSVATGK